MIIPFSRLPNYDIGFIHILAMRLSSLPQSLVNRKLGRNDHMLHYHVSGIRTYTFEDGTQAQLSPGDILLLPYKSNYISVVEGTSEAIGYNIRFSLVDDRGERVEFSDQPHVLLRDTAGAFFPYFKDLAELTIAANHHLRMQAKLSKLLDKLVTACQNLSDAGWLNAAMNYMGSNLQRPVTLSELCSICHMSERSFCRLFKDATCVSPITWHRRLRIRKAEELLSSGMCTLESVSEILGFTDSAHLSRSLYRETGRHASEIVSGLRDRSR